MIRYSTKSKFVATLILIQFCLLSCVKADRELGSSMIPPSQLMDTYVDSFAIIPRTYIYQIDSIQTNRTSLSNLPIGSYIDPLVGRSDIQFYTNYTPKGFEIGSTEFFGDKPVIDSMFLLLNLTGYKGDTIQGLEFKIYEVTKGYFPSRKNFYSNTNMQPYLNDTALITFKVKSPEMISQRLPMKFAEKFLINDHDKNNPYYSDTMFQQTFKGLYFNTNIVDKGKEGCIYNVDLAGSAMMLFYHTVRNNVPDTTSITLLLYDKLYTPYGNQFVTVQHDYDLADPSVGGVIKSEIGDSTIQTKRCYVEAPAGLGTVIEFPEENINQLHNKVKERGFKHIGVHNALLTLYVENPVWQNYEKMYKHLAAYLSFATFSYIPDYNPLLGTTDDIGGELNRSLGIYQMDITSYMQKLLTGKITRNKIVLAPVVEQMLSPMRSVIKGSASDNPPQLTLTYTLMK